MKVIVVVLFFLSTMTHCKNHLQQDIQNTVINLEKHSDPNQIFQDVWTSILEKKNKATRTSNIDFASVTDHDLPHNKMHQPFQAKHNTSKKNLQYEQPTNTYKIGEMKKHKHKKIIIPKDSPNFKKMGENLFLKNLKHHIKIPSITLKCMKEMVKKDYITLLKPSIVDSNPLFEVFPLLSKTIPYISLGTFPTPIQKLNNLRQELSIPNLYIKRDDLSGKISQDGSRLFGGNKVRKLEFLLGEALEHNAKTVITFGCIASNHAVATAAYAQHLGLKTIIMVKPQPNSSIVRKNLLLMQHYGADIHFCPDGKMREKQTIDQFIEYKQRDGNFPYFIPTGGSMPVGIIGFVNAVFELREQIQAGQIPEPDRIYIPAGSWGSSVGLLLGIKAVHLKTKVMIIAIEPEENLEKHKEILFDLFNKTNKYLHSCDNTFPLFELTEKDFAINHAFTGNKYGQFTQEGYTAIKVFQEQENINLDGTYTAKAVAAMLDDLKNLENKNQVILYWHTYCGDSFESILSNQNYHTLSTDLQYYFENPVQEFDK